MNILQLIVDNVDDLMTAGYTVIRVYTDTVSTGTFVTLDGTETLVAAQESYEYEDNDGTSATWYKTAYYGAGPGESAKSDARQGDTWAAYASLEDLKEYLGIATATRDEDVLLSDLLDRATKAIDNYTGRVFWPATETRYYESGAVEDRVLYLDRDLVSVTTLTNGDSDSTSISSSDYWLLPRNDGPPYYGIRLKSSVSTTWEFDVDYWVSVAGTWGWSSTPPLDIEQACIRWASYMFRQKDASVFDTTAIPDQGVILSPQGIPRDVRLMLDPYVRRS